MGDKPTSWLWPDHLIRKSESRVLREEHNHLVNLNAQMAEALDALIKTAINADDDPVGYRGALRASIEQARAALRAAGVEP